MDSIFDLILIFVGLVGFSVAFYIRYKKTKKRPLVCPLRSNCDNVIHSDFSKFFGIPVEILGMFYYALVAIYHGLLIVYPEIASNLTVFISLVFSTGAFLFSIYLISIQAFVLKEWCTWCLFSAFLCASIFGLTISSSAVGLVEILAIHGKFFTILHLLGVALGVGAATITDIFFFGFLKDYKISFEESRIMKMLSNVIWFALGLLVLSGIALFLPKSEELIVSGKFLTKMFAILVLIINGFILNIVISPKLMSISFIEEYNPHGDRFYFIRKLSFALGAISITSWYFIFILGALRGMTISFIPLVLGYIGLLVLAVIGSQLFDYFFVHHKTEN